MNVHEFYNPRYISDRYGAPRDGGARRHQGVDFSHTTIPGDVPIPAIESGTVVNIGYPSNMHGFGYFIDIESGTGLWRYAHLADEPHVFVGGEISQGDYVGLEGDTGATDGVCVHVELFRNGGRTDPEPYIYEITQSWYGGDTVKPDNGKEMELNAMFIADCPNGWFLMVPRGNNRPKAVVLEGGSGAASSGIPVLKFHTPDALRSLNAAVEF